MTRLQRQTETDSGEVLANRLQRIEGKYKMLKRKYEDARAELLDYAATTGRDHIGSAAIVAHTRKGNVSADLVKAAGLDVDDFRGPDISYRTVEWIKS